MTPSFPPILLSRTHLSTYHSGRRALEGFILDGGSPPRKPSLPHPTPTPCSASPVLQVDTASICGSFSVCDSLEIIFARTTWCPDRVAGDAKGQWNMFL